MSTAQTNTHTHTHSVIPQEFYKYYYSENPHKAFLHSWIFLESY